MTISLKTYIILKWLLFIAAVFFMVCAVLFGLHFFYENKYSDRYFPGTRISGIEVGGLNRSEAEKIINDRINNIEKNGVVFSYYTKQKTLDFLPASTDADASLAIADFDASRAMEESFYYARNGSFFGNIKNRMSLWNSGKDFEIDVLLRSEDVQEFLNENFGDFSTPAQNASLVISTSTKYKEARFEVTEEVNGQILDFNKALNDLERRLKHLDNDIIFLEMTLQYPTVLKKDIGGMEEKAKETVERAPIALTYKQDKWEIDKDKLMSLIEVKTAADVNDTKKAYIGINNELAKAYLSDNVAKKINKPVIDAKFEIVDGRVNEFKGGQNGEELDIDEAIRRIEEYMESGTSSEIELPTKVVESKDTKDEMESFGLKEIIGTGHSSFAGSPKNRRHNIKTGAESVNGTLIAPGEEFSLLKTLGKIDETNGYLPELVIKEGKTLPEYGGGLCQIGTTVFRATVKSGLPVTMRRNHSYRVGYYEPAGTDATIYDPWPDYKFKNDTAHHILIQTRIEGDHLYFDFWGTKDGRMATSTYPTIYNIVKPDPPKMIETLDLKPGKKKCTETAHNGADAYFDYKVTYPDGKVDQTRFKSHYVPWQAVCLIGVDKLTKDKEKEAIAASSTESIKN